MNVNQLRKLIKDKTEHLKVILQKDPEGNGFAVCAGVDGDNLIYKRDDVLFQTLTPELAKQGYGEGEPCIVLYPEH